MLYYSDRNYGCRFLEVFIHGQRSLIMENSKIRITIILDAGGRIVELLHKPTDTDFMWRTPIGLSSLNKRHVQYTDPFHGTYAGGWFEAFPNVGLDCTYKNAPLDSYDELVYLPWEYEVKKDSAEEIQIRMFVKLLKTPFFVEKTLTLKSNDSTLYISEKVTNTGNETMDYQWGHHPNIGMPFLDEHCIIELEGADMNIHAALEKSRLIQGYSGKWPVAEGKNGEKVDLREIPPAIAGVNDLVWLSNLKGNEITIVNNKKNLSFTMEWDPEMFTNCLLWIVANGDPGFPRYNNTYVLCILPSTSDIHTLEKASEAGDCKQLNAGETIETWINTRIKPH